MRPDLVRTPTQHIITVTYGLTFPQKTKKHKNTNMAKLYWLSYIGYAVMAAGSGVIPSLKSSFPLSSEE